MMIENMCLCVCVSCVSSSSNQTDHKFPLRFTFFHMRRSFVILRLLKEHLYELIIFLAMIVYIMRYVSIRTYNILLAHNPVPSLSYPSGHNILCVINFNCFLHLLHNLSLFLFTLGLTNISVNCDKLMQCVSTLSISNEELTQLFLRKHLANKMYTMIVYISLSSLDTNNFYDAYF